MPNLNLRFVEQTDTRGKPARLDRRPKRSPPAESPSASVASKQRRIALLTRTIETRVLPQLALSHRLDDARAPEANRLPIGGTAELKSFMALVIANDLQACIARVEQLAARGLGLADICLSLLAPAARRFGEMWNDDRCSFADVTAWLGTLRSITYRLPEICRPAQRMRDASRRVVLASLSGNRHSFGLQVVSEVFRDAGWHVTLETAVAEDDLLELVRSSRFAVAGLSIGRREEARTLGRTIRAIREASCNQAIGILVGGPALGGSPDLARLVGADVAAGDARQALSRAEGLRLLKASLEDQPIGGLA